MERFMFKNLLTIFVFIFLSDIALAHGPSRQKVSLTIDINAPVDKVWQIVSNFKEFKWNENVKDSKTSSNKVGSERVITFKDGGLVKQKLEKVNSEKKMVSWRVIETDNKVLPVNSYAAKVFVKADGDNKTSVTYKSGFYRGFMGNDPPQELNDENSKRKVQEFIGGNLKGLKKIAESN